MAQNAFDLKRTLLECSLMEKERQLAVLQNPTSTVDVIIRMHIIPEGAEVNPGFLGKNFFRDVRASPMMIKAMVHDAIAVTVTEIEEVKRKLAKYKRRK